MSELLGLLAIGSMIPIGILILVIYVAFRYRSKFIIVHEFSNENVNLPKVINKVPNEIIAKYAYSFTKTNQFFLTDSRIVFFYESILKGRYFTKYLSIESVKNTEIVYKNPYGWLIIAGINILVSIISGISSCSSKSSNSYFRDSGGLGGAIFGSIILTLVITGIFGLIWYYLKGYYLVFDNNRVSGLFCRSREGLVDVLKIFDYLKFNKTKQLPPELRPEPLSSKDITCKSCKSVITLDKNDLMSDTFICPICATVNSIK